MARRRAEAEGKIAARDDRSIVKPVRYSLHNSILGMVTA